MDTPALVSEIRRMWIDIVETDDTEALAEISEDALRGAAYAELSAAGAVELSDGALPYLKCAHDELSSLSPDTSDDEYDEDEEGDDE